MLGTALSGLLATLIALAFVLGLAWLGLKALKTWQDRITLPGGTEAQNGLTFVRALPVGQKERVMLIEAQNELMLIGVAQGSVTLLARWPAQPNPEGPRE